MRPNALTDKIAAGGSAVNGWLAMPSTVAAEAMARSGFDSITVDMQHGMIDYSDVVGMLQAISQTDATPLVRVPWLDPAMIMKALDAGAYGIICPMINSPEEAERFVRYASYAPRGDRSFGPIRAIMYGGADYQPNANATIATFAMIETVQAFDMRDEIIATPDLTGIYVGPSDLGLSMGYTPQLDSEQPEVLAAIEAILTSIKAQNKIACVHCSSAAYGKRMLDMGFDLVSAGSEMRLMVAGAQAWIAGAGSKAASKDAGGGY